MRATVNVAPSGAEAVGSLDEVRGEEQAVVGGDLGDRFQPGNDLVDALRGVGDDEERPAVALPGLREAREAGRVEPGRVGVEDAPGDRDVAVAPQRLGERLVERAALEHHDGRLRPHHIAELLDGAEESELGRVTPNPPVGVDRERDRRADDHDTGDPGRGDRAR